MWMQRFGQRGLLAVAAALTAISTVQAAPPAAGHWVGSDGIVGGVWNNRNSAFIDATVTPLGGQRNTTPTGGVSINGHGSIFFDALSNDGASPNNLNTGGSFTVPTTAAVISGGTNPTSGARGISFTAAFQSRGNVPGRSGAHWQNSDFIGNERGGGNRGDFGFGYEGSTAHGWQSDNEVIGTTSGMNSNTLQIVTYNIVANTVTALATNQIWVNGVLENSINSPWLAADVNRRLEVGESGFSIGASTVFDNGDTGFIHGDLAELRVDSFAAPSAGNSVNLTNAEVVALHNHLSSKYGSSLAGNDFYAGDAPGLGNYDNGVMGIVGITGSKVTGSNDAWLTSLNSSGLTINELGGSLADTEGVFAGHNQLVDTSVAANSIVNDGAFNRSSRVWYVDETGAVDFSLTFDLSDMGIGFSQSPVLLFANSTALNFNALAITPTISGDQYTYNLSSIPNPDGFYTLGVALPEPTTIVTWLLVATVGLVWGSRRMTKR